MKGWSLGYWICVALVAGNGVLAYFAPEADLAGAATMNAGICAILALACWANANAADES